MSFDDIPSQSAATIARELCSRPDGMCLVCGALPLWICDHVKHRKAGRDLPDARPCLPVHGRRHDDLEQPSEETIALRHRVEDLSEQLVVAAKEITCLKKELRSFTVKVSAECASADKEGDAISDRHSKRRECSTVEIDVESMSRLVYGRDAPEPTPWESVCARLRSIVRIARLRIGV